SPRFISVILLLASLGALGYSLFRWHDGTIRRIRLEHEKVLDYHLKEAGRLEKEIGDLKNRNGFLMMNMNQLQVMLEKTVGAVGRVKVVFDRSKNVKTKRYSITFVGENFKTEIEKKIDTIYPAVHGFLEKEFGFMRHEKTPLIEVKIFDTKENYENYRELLGIEKRTSGGSYLSYYKEIVLYAGDRDDLTLYRNATHETTHYIIDNHVHKPPLWLNEGFAVYFENSVAGDYSFDYGRVNPWMLGELKKAFKLGHYVPFDEFINTRSGDFEVINYQNPLQQIIGYAQSWIMVALFLHTSKENRDTFKEYMTGLLRGSDTTLEEFLGGKKLNELETQWSDFIENIE
ncbi:MAG: hypothetical protein AB1742_07750, partial [bacterium]